MASDDGEWGRVIPFEQGQDARLAAATTAVIELTGFLVQERDDYRAFREATWVEMRRRDEEHAAVVAGYAYAIAKRDEAIRRVAWAVWLDERVSALVGGLALVWDALTAPRAREVGRTHGPSDSQLAAVAGVLVLFAALALFGLVG